MCDAFWFLKAILPFQVLSAYPLAAASVTNSLVVVRGGQYNQLQYHPSSIGNLKVRVGLATD